MHAYAGRQFVPFLWWSLVWPGREANSRPAVREVDTLPTEPTRHGFDVGTSSLNRPLMFAVQLCVRNHNNATWTRLSPLVIYGSGVALLVYFITFIYCFLGYILVLYNPRFVFPLTYEGVLERFECINRYGLRNVAYLTTQHKSVPLLDIWKAM